MRKTMKFSGLLVALLLAAGGVDAAGLGRLSVQSSLGQPLEAEIELRSVNQDELATITARLAGAEAFKQAHIDRANILNSLQFSVDQRANGQPVIRVTSSQPIADPFLDMLIELDWTSGRVLREYTILLDPPFSAKGEAATPVTPPAAKPVVQAPMPAPEPVAAAEPAPAPGEFKPEQPAAAAARSAEPLPAEAQSAKRDAAPTESRAARAEPAPETAQGASYGPVKSGETLRRIAAKVKPESLTLEQMMVGLYQANEGAFSGGDMNRLKRGQVLVVPDSDNVNLKTSPADAHRIIQTHAAKWQAYRRKVAEMAGEAPTVEAPSAASGKVSAKAPEVAPAPAAAPKDVLRVSKGEPGGQDAKTKERLRAMEEEAAAKARALQESNDRVAHLERTVRDMEQLIKLKSNQPAAPAQPAPAPTAAPAAPAAAPVAEVAPPPPPPQPKPAPAAPVVAPAPVAPPETSWLDTFLSNPIYLGGVVAALALSAALWLMMMGTRRRKGLNKFEDSIMTGGDFNHGNPLATGASAAQSAAGAPTEGSMLLTDFSRLGLGSIDTHEVDPIAEAEVYMAYGRDAQAEEILKEALNKDPSRHEIALKLLEIYAVRKDTLAYETVASELYASIGGQPTPLWAKAAEMGRSIDPTNPLYRAPVETSASMSSFDDFPMPKQSLSTDFAQDFQPSRAAPADDDFDFSPPKPAAYEREAPAQQPLDDNAFGMGGAKDFDFDDGHADNSSLAWDTPAKSAPAWDDEPAAPAAASFAPASFAPEPAPYTPAFEPEADLEPVAAPEPAYQSPWQTNDDGLDFDEPPAPAEEMPVLDLSGIDLELDAVPATPADEPWAAQTPAVEVAKPTAAPALRSLPEASDFALVEPDEMAMDFADPTAHALAAEPEPALDLTADDDFDAFADLTPAQQFAPAALDFSVPQEDDYATPEPVELAAPAAPPDAADAEVWEEVNTKLDLARAYLEMGDKEGAREILQEVMGEGDTQQKADADKLLAEAG